MSEVKVAPHVTIDPSIFWTNKGSLAIDQTLTNLVSQVGDLVAGIGDVTSKFKELTFDVGNLTYHYIGNWTLNVDGGLLGAVTSGKGSYSKVIIDKAGKFLASLDLDKALNVDLGSQHGLDIAGLNLGDLLEPTLNSVLGTVDKTLDNLNLNATPDLVKLVDGLIPGGPSGNKPTIHDDVLEGTSGRNVINALAGNDKVHGLAGNDTIHGNGGNDRLWGDAGKDKLYGDAGKDTLLGGDGNDKLFGGTGNDRLRGGSGHDVLTGGKGRDVLWGGHDADTFVFTRTSDSTASAKGRDTIMDFSQTDHDKISLHRIDADTTHKGNQDFHFESGGHFTKQAGELITEIKGSNTYVLGDTNGDGKADFEIRLHGEVHLQASDFML